MIDKVRDATKNADLTVGKVAEYADTGLGAISVGKDLADVVAGDYSAVQDLFDDGVEFIQTLLGDAFETPIIEAGLLLLDSYSVVCGDPVTPDVGAMFGNGASAFERVEAQVKSAEPTGDWTGTSSIAYALADSQQATRAADMSRADGKLQRIIADEAQQVEQTRNFIDDRGSELHIAILPALAALAPIFEPEGLAVSVAIQIAAVAATVPPATDKVVEMAWKASANARNIAAVADEYRAAAGEHVRTDVGLSMPGAPSASGSSAPGSSAPVAPAPAGPGGLVGPAGAAPLPGAPGTPGSPGTPRSPGPGESPGLPGMSGGGGGAAAPGGGAAGGAGTPAASEAPVSAAPTAGIPTPGSPASGAPASGASAAPLGSLPGLPGGIPGGAAGGGGPGLLSSLLGPAAQALSPIGQGNAASGAQPLGSGAGGAPGSALGQAPVAAGPRPAESVAGAEPTDTEQDGPARSAGDTEVTEAKAGPGGQGPRAPIHLELELDPEQLSEPVRLTLDPKNVTPPPGPDA
ncbi:MAG: hypothetical protein KDB71_09665 [Mycobacterium sp.]|nr:hypothetical protein [Mycobacterium sp.]